MAWSDYNDDGALDIFIDRGALGGTAKALPEDVSKGIQDQLFVTRAGAPPYRNVAAEVGIDKRGCSGRKVNWVDFNRDGLGDIALLHGKTSAVTVLLNTTVKGSATLTFATGVDFATAQQASRVEIEDVNGDGVADIVVGTATGTFSVLLNTTASQAAQPRFTTHDFSIGDGSRFARLTDLNGDGKLDVLAMTKIGVSIAVNTSTGATPRWSDPIEVDASSAVPAGNYSGTMNVGAADFNGDGKVDLVVTSFSPQNAQADTISIMLAL